MNDSNPNSGPDTHSDSSFEYPRLSEALKALSKPRMKIPESVDAAIRAEARKRLQRVVPLPHSEPRRGFWIPIGLAASFLLLVWVMTKSGLNQGTTMALRGDVDASGQVNMLDAYILARKLQRQAPSEPSQDINGDGVVDGQDLKMVMEAAVLLERQGGI